MHQFDIEIIRAWGWIILGGMAGCAALVVLAANIQ